MININSDSFALSSSNRVTGEISLQLDGNFFPEYHWNDFVVILLNWWSKSFKDLLYGSVNSEFSFMDGPFMYSIVKGENSWTIFCYKNDIVIESIKVSEVRRLLTSFIKTLNGTLRICKNKGWNNDDITALAVELQDWQKLRTNIQDEQIFIRGNSASDSQLPSCLPDRNII